MICKEDIDNNRLFLAKTVEIISITEHCFCQKYLHATSLLNTSSKYDFFTNLFPCKFIIFLFTIKRVINYFYKGKE